MQVFSKQSRVRERSGVIIALGKTDVEDSREPSHILSPLEYDEYRGRPQHKQKEWLMGRALAKQVLQHAYSEQTKLEPAGMDIQDIQIVGQRGIAPSYLLPKDDLENNSEKNQSFILSISHCEEVVIAGIAPRLEYSAFGIDVERIRTFAQSTVEAFMTESELTSYNLLLESERNRHATITWSIKEAYLKALGVGLRVHPGSISAVLHQEEGTACLYREGVHIDGTIEWTVLPGDFIMSTVLL